MADQQSGGLVSWEIIKRSQQALPGCENRLYNRKVGETVGAEPAKIARKERRAWQFGIAGVFCRAAQCQLQRYLLSFDFTPQSAITRLSIILIVSVQHLQLK
ncbi:hypothetical protein CFRS1_v004879 [Colletotrichum fructicola]|nr:hypothetical protein CFRS1_v004879 [Colletotrichum fructicola]